MNGVANTLIGNGYCDDEMNITECNFDGGDCCGHCETITITLENNVKHASGDREGIYHYSSMVNGRPCWTSSSQAIWYDQQLNNWNIGLLDNIETTLVGFYSNHGSQCPFDLPSEMWFYWVDNDWTSAGTNEINVACLYGNFS